MSHTLLGIGGLGTPELVVIAIVIFLLFGATRLPQLAKAFLLDASLFVLSAATLSRFSLVHSLIRRAT